MNTTAVSVPQSSRAATTQEASPQKKSLSELWRLARIERQLNIIPREVTLELPNGASVENRAWRVVLQYVAYEVNKMEGLDNSVEDEEPDSTDEAFENSAKNNIPTAYIKSQIKDLELQNWSLNNIRRISRFSKIVKLRYLLRTYKKDPRILASQEIEANLRKVDQEFEYANLAEQISMINGTSDKLWNLLNSIIDQKVFDKLKEEEIKNRKLPALSAASKALANKLNRWLNECITFLDKPIAEIMDERKKNLPKDFSFNEVQRNEFENEKELEETRKKLLHELNALLNELDELNNTNAKEKESEVKTKIFEICFFFFQVTYKKIDSDFHKQCKKFSFLEGSFNVFCTRNPEWKEFWHVQYKKYYGSSAAEEPTSSACSTIPTAAKRKWLASEED